MNAKLDPARLDRLVREAARLRRSAEDLSIRHHATLAEHRRLFRTPRPELAERLSALLTSRLLPARPPRLHPGPSPHRRMVGIARDAANLATADRHMAEGEKRVARQRDLIAELRRDGHATRQAEELLVAFVRTLDAWRAHRSAVAATITSAERRPKRAGHGADARDIATVA